MTILIQLLRILFAYLLASLITGYVVQASMLISDSGTGGVNARELTMGLLVTFFIAWLAAFPASLTVAIGEWRQWRMWWYYGLAGSLIGLVLGTLFQPPAYFPYLGLSFGFVSGLIYWGVAGKRAGLEDDSQRKAVVMIMGLSTIINMFTGIFGLVGAAF
jgi:hypothetical protein